MLASLPQGCGVKIPTTTRLYRLSSKSLDHTCNVMSQPQGYKTMPSSGELRLEHPPIKQTPYPLPGAGSFLQCGRGGVLLRPGT